MSKDIASSAAPAQPFDSGVDHHGPDTVKLGQWYWVSETVAWDGQWHHEDDEGERVDRKKGDIVKWLGCVSYIGSNFVKLKSPPKDRSSRSIRVHFDEFHKVLEFAPDAEEHINERQRYYKNQVNLLLGQVNEITAKLGVVPTKQVMDHTGEGQNALVVVSAQPDTTKYKNALILASEKQLPELFKKIAEANQELARWMSASTLPLMAGVGSLEKTVAAIKDRIYTIELYAGLTEEAVKVRDGKPADRDEMLHIMQRRLYMDEECLMNYTAGGMEFKDIEAFDKWLSKRENYERILPFPRALVAFRVRRNEKEREHSGNFLHAYINFQLSQIDKATFLYVRNGTTLWRINCDFEFEEMIVPNKEQFDPSVPMMVKISSWEDVKDFIPKQRYESLCETHKLHKAWMKKHNGKPKPGEKDRHYYRGDSPYYNEVGSFDPDEWTPFDQSNVYFDEALKELADQIKRYNRIAVIVQGLFDRSEVLHPHAPVKMWEAESFQKAVTLVYDAVTLTHGEKPDFETYRSELNASLNAASIVTGQEDFWLRREAERENKRIETDWRHRGTNPNYVRFSPYGDKGPGLVGPMAEWKARSRMALFRWNRESRNGRSRDLIAASILVPATELFNVTAYKSGDYKQFFTDPRTRREYLKWAPLMLAAEDFHAGKLDKRKSTKGSVRAY